MLDFDEFLELMKNRDIDVAMAEEEEAVSDEAELEKLLLGRMGKAMASSQDMRRSSMFGRLAVANESGSDLVESLRSLDQELLKTSDSKKKQFLQAKEKCPQLIGDKFKMMFLRAEEEYDPKRAAIRLVQYWEERVRIFCAEKAFLPLTQAQALHDDQEVIKHGIVKAMNKKDTHGQTLVFVDFSGEKKGNFDGTSKARAFWYVLHSILEDEDAQLKGVVYLVKPFPSLRDFDPKMLKLFIYAARFYLPMRLACIHICYVPSFVNMIGRVENIFAGQIKHRRRMHRGTDEKVLAELESYGIPNDCVPFQLAGSCQVDHLAWLEAKREASL